MSGKYFPAIVYRTLILLSFIFIDASCNLVESSHSPSSAGLVHRLNNSNSGQIVSVSLRDTINIRLQTIGPGEYGAPEISASSINFEKTVPAAAEEINPGGPVQHYLFAAALPGRAKISIPHSYAGTVFEVTIDVNRF